MTEKHVVTGVITLVQEQRFQLVDDAGVAHLFLLAHDVALTPADLREVQRGGERVQVEYENCSEIVARLATRLEFAYPHETPAA